MQQAGNAGGKFNATGNFDTAKKAGQVDFKLDDLNQVTLKTFLGPALKDKQLVTASISANASAKIDPAVDSSIKALLSITNLVVSDPSQPKPIGPLEAKLNLDSSLAKQVLEKGWSVRRLDLRRKNLEALYTDVVLSRDAAAV